jgi:hypothetical protein
MYVSIDDGRRWQSLQLNLPVTPVTDLVVSQGDLVLSTNGRSFWILDDVTPLRELAARPVSVAHLFPPRDTYRLQTSAEEADDAYVFGECCVANARDLYTGARIDRHQLGEEAPDGAIIYVSFPQVQTEPVTLSILGAGNAPIRSIFDTTKRVGKTPRLVAGLNRFSWDLRTDPVSVGRTPLLGRKVTPGTYQVKLTVGANSQTTVLKVLLDSRLARAHVTTSDLQKQSDLLAELQDAIVQVQRAAVAIRERRADLTQSGAAPSAGPSDAAAELNALERELVGAGDDGRGGRGGGRGSAQPLLAELTSLYNFVSESEDKPTAGAVTRWTDLKRSIEAALARVNARMGSAGRGANRP